MTASGAFFVRAQGHKGADIDGYATLKWPAKPGHTKSVVSELAWSLAPLKNVSLQVVDLVHVAASAYMADRSLRRGSRFSRDIALEVAVLARDAWTDDLLDTTASLLHWLTGDNWNLTVNDALEVNIERSSQPGVDGPVSLLSGGLDSYLGAILLLTSGAHPTFVGHKDTATSIRMAQTVVESWLAQSYTPVPTYTRFELTQASRRKEPSSRSRAFMFLSLGVAIADSTGAKSVIVPENGYTGINLPLRPNRGGALSTRSTHPETFRRVAEILGALNVDITISNPFEWMTKGEAMETIRDLRPPAGWEAAAAATLSCSKLGGNWFSGSPNLNCGLCVPCMVRRATFVKARVDDQSPYLFQAITGTHLSDLIDARRGDIEAVRYAIEAGVDVDAIDSGTWPPYYDLDRVEDLVQRGLDELALLELP
ncbi:queuosine biosynthesis protein queC [Mycolicibacterium sp. P9-64]|uniref:7-cyano-7-deazaguanine synthase n=1 Tax=Mycolicibacterium sp. P9-64 TaxID=2024612 RepID=UPI0011EF034E|nr:7-cyano-7-deazaguanine synthase [Mycolicibacterium sp. P9-64]KAA0085574.1 queuosine biosynthesis protein queC [Mycolicibacterium sp. P9-64]